MWASRRMQTLLATVQRDMGLKIAVYGICKNEAQFVHLFMTHLHEADGIFVTDTGSTDNTRELLEEHGVHVTQCEVVPWRFDSEGWRAKIERVWAPDAHRVRYQYVWNTLPDGRDGVTMWYDRIHRRHGFKWAKPVHEVLQLENGARNEIQVYSNNIKLRHYPDNSKSRSSYIPLLEMACREDAEDDRSCHYLGRDYLHNGLYEKAIAELQRHLSLKSATWRPEVSTSTRTTQGTHADIASTCPCSPGSVRSRKYASAAGRGRSCATIARKSCAAFAHRPVFPRREVSLFTTP